MSPSVSQRRWHGPLAGIVSLLVALGASLLVAGLGRSLRSPILDVGDRVIDVVPEPVKALAIDLFGTNDKIALLIGIGLTLALFAAAIGVVATRWSRPLGVAGIGLFGLVGALASTGGFAAALPSVLGAAAGAVTLWMLTLPDVVDEDRTGASRRSFLRFAGVAGLGAVAMAGSGLLLDRRFDVADSRAGLDLPPARRPLPALDPDASFPEAGIEPFVTPNADFYRIDTALQVPRIDVANHRLSITGMVDRPMELTFRELLDREVVEADITLACVSNEVGGSLVGNARWLGVRLDDLLDEAGIDPAATQIVGRSVDGYTCGFPVDTLDGRDSLVAVGMNGEPLPLEHGYPMRLVVPGLYGYTSATKWLNQIELTTFDAFDHYWVRRGWAEIAPIKTQSRIDTPGPLERIPAGPTAIGGVAWAQTRGISAVEVRIDDGPWQGAELAAAVHADTWRQWRLPWDATPGRHSLTVRATDGSGQVQPEERTRPIPDGAAGWHMLVVLVDG